MAGTAACMINSLRSKAGCRLQRASDCGKWQAVRYAGGGIIRGDTDGNGKPAME